MTEQELRLKILDNLLSACTEMYKENARVSTVLEDKAQKTGAIAGLFLAAAFGFAKKDNIADLFTLSGDYGILALLICVLLFLFCVFCCLSVLWVQAGSGPVSPTQLYGVTNALLGLTTPLLGTASENHVRDQISAWLPILEAQRKVNFKKATRLTRAQRLLASAMIVLVVVLVLLTTFVSKARRRDMSDRGGYAMHRMWP